MQVSPSLVFLSLHFWLAALYASYSWPKKEKDDSFHAKEQSTLLTKLSAHCPALEISPGARHMGKFLLIY